MKINQQPYLNYISIKENDYIFKEIKFGNFNITAELTEEKPKEIIAIMISERIEKKKVPSNKYDLAKITVEKIEFTDFNFKLAVIEELMYSKDFLKPKFDIYEFVELYNKREIDIENEGYEPIPEVVEYFKNLGIDKKFANEITEIYQDGGNEIYMNIIPFWDGEDDTFNIKSYEDIKHFPNLKKMTLFCQDEKILDALKAKGIDVEPL